MKVLWINDAASFVGGAETYIYQTAQGLSEYFDVENILLYNAEGRIDTTYANVFTFTTVMANITEQIEALNPDIIYVHQVQDSKVLKSLLDINIPVIGFVHDHKHFCLREHKYTTIGHNTCTKAIGMDCYTCLGFINKATTFPYISTKSVSSVKAVQDILKQFDQMIVASDYMKSHLLLHDFSEQKIAKIVLFSKQTDIKFPSKQVEEKRFLFVGQLIRGKGVDTLLKAFKNVPEDKVYLDICGEGKQREELEELCKNLDIEKRVVFHGKVKPEVLSKYYLNAYMVVIPSRAPETFNLVGLEAMKHAKAVIATEVGGIDEWLIDGHTGYGFPSNDYKRLEGILKLVIQDPNKIRLMGEAGLHNYTNNFTSKKHCNSLYDVFKKTIKKDTYVS